MTRMVRKPIRCIAASVLAVILWSGTFFIGAHAADTKADAGSQLQSMESTVVILDNAQDMTAIDIKATVGNVTVRYGSKPQIEVGSEIMRHASFAYRNGTIMLRDHYDEKDLSFVDIDSDKYHIAITIPNHLKLKTLSLDVGIGAVDLQNIMAGDTGLTAGLAKINLDGFHSDSLVINSDLAEISAADISITDGLQLYSFGSKAVISGEIRGNVLVDSDGISNTDITFTNSNRADYSIQSTWEPGSESIDTGNLLFRNGSTGIMIDGEKYGMEYSDANTGAPNQLTVVSRELLPMDNIVIRFVKKEA